jgi:CDP-glucose 4,6-dehydratase
VNESWRGRRVFVTGANGFLGSWLIDALLERDAAVVALVRRANPRGGLYRSGNADRVSIVTGLVQDYDLIARTIARQAIDTVFHLGAQADIPVANRSPLAAFDANIRGTYQVLEACRRAGPRVSRVVVASSDKAYGDQPQPCTEESPLLARHPYAVSKSCADLIAQTYFRTYGLPVVIMRCGNTYGGGDLNWRRIVPGTIRHCLERTRPVLRGDGAGLRDYLYIKDAVDAYLRVGAALDDRIHGEAFNFSEERPYSARQMIEIIQRLMGCEALVPEVRRGPAAEIRDQSLSAAKARAMLAWRPRFALEAGLVETIAWYEAFLAELAGGVGASRGRDVWR